MSSRGTTITVTNSSSVGQRRNIIKIFRFIHLLLNVICVGLASYDWNWFKLIKDHIPIIPVSGYNLEQTNERIFFLVVTITLMVASLALLLLFSIKSNRSDSDVLNPKLEVTYYSIGFILLFIASVILIARLDYLGAAFWNLRCAQAGVSFAFINSVFYLASAILLRNLEA